MGRAQAVHQDRAAADGLTWTRLVTYGWRDPQSPERAYLVAELVGGLTGVALRCLGPSPLQKRSNICSLCLRGKSR